MLIKIKFFFFIVAVVSEPLLNDLLSYPDLNCYELRALYTFLSCPYSILIDRPLMLVLILVLKFKAVFHLCFMRLATTISNTVVSALF